MRRLWNIYFWIVVTLVHKYSSLQADIPVRLRVTDEHGRSHVQSVGQWDPLSLGALIIISNKL